MEIKIKLGKLRNIQTTNQTFNKFFSPICYLLYVHKSISGSVCFLFSEWKIDRNRTGSKTCSAKLLNLKKITK